jgi:hypothetical protein
LGVSPLPQILRRFQIAASISRYHVTTKRTNDAKDSKISFLDFGLFATFVVKFAFFILVAALPRWALCG